MTGDLPVAKRRVTRNDQGEMNATGQVARRSYRRASTRRTEVETGTAVAASLPADVERARLEARWQSVEVRHLVALAAVAREGSFRHAAEELGYVQSAISGQIAHLEQAAGIRLLERASGTPVVELTPAGRILLRHVEEILSRFDGAYADINSLATRGADAIRVTGLDLLSPHRTAAVLALFRQRHPFVRVTIADAAVDANAIAQLRDGTLDLLVWEPPDVPDSLTHVVLECEDYVLLVPAASDLAERRLPLDAAELAELRPIVPSSCLASRALVAQLDELDVGRHPTLVPGSVVTAQALVAHGLGTAIVSRGLTHLGDPGTVGLEISHLIRPRTIALAFDAERSSAAVGAFVRAARDVCAHDDDAGTDAARDAAAACSACRDSSP
jgi:DNA-binding transcriptional LysR family regulator